ncbi:MAG: tetrahydromethanopterin S-methyltransferase subunit B [Thermoproteota archaeon]
MATIIISPDLDIILDAESKIVGEARSDVAVLDTTPLEKKIAELELLADELVNSLNPKSSPLISSRAGREGLYLKAGFLSNMVIGFLVGLAIFSIGVVAYLAFSSPELIQKLVSMLKPPA